MITGIRDFTTTPLPIPKNFLVVYLLKLSSECLVSYDPHFPGNDGTNKSRVLVLVLVYGISYFLGFPRGKFPLLLTNEIVLSRRRHAELAAWTRLGRLSYREQGRRLGWSRENR